MRTRLVLPDYFTERDAELARDRGYLSHVLVALPDGTMHPVYFTDACRLQQDLEDEVKRGKCFLAERGLIILTEVTLPNAANAVESLFDQGYFTLQ